MRLSDLLPDEVKGISIVGMSKNAGKTTLLNRLLREFEEKGERVGLVSAGVDGEKADVWSGLPKPPIHPYPGTCVVTALQAIREGSARFRLMERINESVIGQEVYLAETVAKGGVKLIGTPSVRLLTRAVSAFRRVGVTYHLIDGAYNRVASANPALIDGILLAVGASSGPSLDVVVERVSEWLIPYRLPIESPEAGASPSIDGETKDLPFDSAEAERDLPRSINGETKSLSFESAEVGEDLFHDIANLSNPFALKSSWKGSDPSFPPSVWVRGALTSRMLTDMMSQKTIPRVVIHDPTRWFVSKEAFLRYQRKGGEVRLRRRPRLLGIGVNPYAPGDGTWNGEEMMARLKEIAPDLPIFDVVGDRLLE